MWNAGALHMVHGVIDVSEVSNDIDGDVVKESKVAKVIHGNAEKESLHGSQVVKVIDGDAAEGSLQGSEVGKVIDGDVVKQMKKLMQKKKLWAGGGGPPPPPPPIPPIMDMGHGSDFSDSESDYSNTGSEDYDNGNPHDMNMGMPGMPPQIFIISMNNSVLASHSMIGSVKLGNSVNVNAFREVLSRPDHTDGSRNDGEVYA